MQTLHGKWIKTRWEDIFKKASQELLKLTIEYHKQQITDHEFKLQPKTEQINKMWPNDCQEHTTTTAGDLSKTHEKSSNEGQERRAEVSVPKILGSYGVNKDARVYAPGWVRNVGVNMLLDTGSAVTLIHKRQLDKVDRGRGVSEAVLERVKQIRQGRFNSFSSSIVVICCHIRYHETRNFYVL